MHAKTALFTFFYITYYYYCSYIINQLTIDGVIGFRYDTYRKTCDWQRKMNMSHHAHAKER